MVLHPYDINETKETALNLKLNKSAFILHKTQESSDA